jgi:hypothetical protein
MLLFLKDSEETQKMKKYYLPLSFSLKAARAFSLRRCFKSE